MKGFALGVTPVLFRGVKASSLAVALIADPQPSHGGGKSLVTRGGDIALALGHAYAYPSAQVF